MTQQQPSSSPSCKRHPLPPRPRPGTTWHSAIPVILFAFLCLSLSGCDFSAKLWDLFHTEGKAEAQVFPDQSQRVRTFIIETDSFRIQTENDSDLTPIGTVTVNDGVTDYTISAHGIVRFNESGGDPNQLFEVESGDRIIERPGANGTGTLTIIDFSPSS